MSLPLLFTRSCPVILHGCGSPHKPTYEEALLAYSGVCSLTLVDNSWRCPDVVEVALDFMDGRHIGVHYNWAAAGPLASAPVLLEFCDWIIVEQTPALQKTYLNTLKGLNDPRPWRPTVDELEATRRSLRRTMVGGGIIPHPSLDLLNYMVKVPTPEMLVVVRGLLRPVAPLAPPPPSPPTLFAREICRTRRQLVVLEQHHHLARPHVEFKAPTDPGLPELPSPYRVEMPDEETGDKLKKHLAGYHLRRWKKRALSDAQWRELCVEWEEAADAHCDVLAYLRGREARVLRDIRTQVYRWLLDQCPAEMSADSRFTTWVSRTSLAAVEKVNCRDYRARLLQHESRTRTTRVVTQRVLGRQPDLGWRHSFARFVLRFGWERLSAAFDSPGGFAV